MGYLAKFGYFERGLLAEDKWEQITLPIIVIAEMLGVAARDLAQFKRWSDARSQIFNKARTPSRRPSTFREVRRPRCDALHAPSISSEQRPFLTKPTPWPT